jgi:superfamily I DNA and/or RNA helicase
LPVVTTQEELLENIVEFIRARHTIEGGLNTLTLQYRMHEEICNAVNRMRQELSPWHDFARLQPSSDVRDRDLEGLGYRYAEERVPQGLCLRREELKEILDPSYTYVVLNSDRLLGNNEEERTRSGSLRNIAEAEAAIDIAVAAHESYQAQEEGLAPTIISPYSAQVYEIKERLRTRHPSYYNILGNRVITAYSSQGREYPMVILSLVRNNPWRRIGFLEDEKLRAQVYVACSRAQAKLVVLMSKNTFGGRPLYEELVNTSTSQHALILGWD